MHAASRSASPQDHWQGGAFASSKIHRRLSIAILREDRETFDREDDIMIENDWKRTRVRMKNRVLRNEKQNSECVVPSS